MKELEKMKKLTDMIADDPFLKSKIFSRLVKDRQKIIDEINFNIQDLMLQTNIRTATWGIIYWEEEFNILIDITDTIENRRARCLAHIRGRGNPTIQHIKNTALSYQCGEIEVHEYFEEYRVEIEFTSVLGVPPKMEDFRDIVRKIIPAHLGISYKFKYNTYDDIKEHKWTYDELKKFTNEEIRSSSEIKAKEG